MARCARAVQSQRRGLDLHIGPGRDPGRDDELGQARARAPESPSARAPESPRHRRGPGPRPRPNVWLLRVVVCGGRHGARRRCWHVHVCPDCPDCRGKSALLSSYSFLQRSTLARGIDGAELSAPPHYHESARPDLTWAEDLDLGPGPGPGPGPGHDLGLDPGLDDDLGLGPGLGLGLARGLGQGPCPCRG